MSLVDRVPVPSTLAEVLDRLITLEPPVNGAWPRPSASSRTPRGAGESGTPALGRLYRAARRQAGRPLAEWAAGAILRRTHPGDCLLLTTGLIAPGIPRGETDGPAGAVALARAAILGCRVRIVLLTEAEAIPVLEATADALAASEGDGAGWRRGLEIMPFPSDIQSATISARHLWRSLAPAALVSVEKLGPNARGVIHNMRGQDVTATQARTDRFFPLARREGALTIGIGDRGNEIGLGGLVPERWRCACPCGGGAACVVRAEVPVVAFTSNWGAYAVAAALGAHLRDPRLLHRPRSEARMLRRMVRAGAVDGTTCQPTPTVDGGGLALQTAVVGLLGALVEHGLNASPRMKPRNRQA